MKWEGSPKTLLKVPKNWLISVYIYILERMSINGKNIL